MCLYGTDLSRASLQNLANQKKKYNVLSIILIIMGILLVMIYTPPWVWFFLLGLILIIIGLLSFNKWK